MTSCVWKTVISEAAMNDHDAPPCRRGPQATLREALDTQCYGSISPRCNLPAIKGLYSINKFPLSAGEG